MIAARTANLKQHDNRYTRVDAAMAASTVSQPEAAKLLDVSRGSVQRASPKRSGGFLVKKRRSRRSPTNSDGAGKR
jgi:hypothetical protein